MIEKVSFSKKTWFCVMAAEILFLVIAGFFLSGRKALELNFAQEELIDDSGDTAFYLDRSSEAGYVATPEFTLPRGFYTLEVQCESAGDAGVRVMHPGSKYHSEVSGDIPLTEKNTVSCDFRVKYADRPLQVRGVFWGDAQEGDYILLRNIHITYAACAVRNTLFGIAIFLLAADGVLYLLCKKRNGGQAQLTDSDKMRYGALALIVCFSSIPLMVDYLFLNSHDLYFHLMRIEGLRAGLESGTLPVRIQPGWLSGHGYAVSVFYGDALLYFPAVLRYFGVSVQAAYKCYVVLVNVLTVCISYYVFSRMSRPETGLCCTVLYSLNIYRLTCIYTRAAVGEYTAIAFMPLVLYGLWKLYTLPEDTKAHKDSWIPITAGCTGIFLSHMISTQITALFIVFASVLCWKRVFCRKTLLVIGKAVSATVLLNLWFLVPFLDYMASGTYVVNNADKYSPYQMEQTGASVAQFFMKDYAVFGHTLSVYEGSASEMPLTVGMALMLVPVGWFFLCMCHRQSGGERKTELLAVFLGCLSLWMTTPFFPYTWLADRISICRLSLVSVQFLWRFFSVSALMLSWLFCLILQRKWILPDRRKLFVGALVGLSLWQGWSYMSQCLQNGEVYRVFQAGNMSTMKVKSSALEPESSVMSGEYLPVDWNAGFGSVETYVTAYTESLTYDETCVNVESWSREKDASLLMTLQNRTDEMQQVEVPILLYKGYQAVADIGEQLSVSPGISCRVSVGVPAGFSGSVRVAFHEPWYWRVCEALSLAALAGMALCRMGLLGKKNAEKQNNFTFSG